MGSGKVRVTVWLVNMFACMVTMVARGFGPFRIWPPEVSAFFHFSPGGFGPSIWKCQIFANLLDFLLFVLSLFPNNLLSKSRTTAIKQGRQLLHEPSLAFYFIFLLHSNLPVQSFPAFRVIPKIIIHQSWSFSFTYRFCFLSVVLMTWSFFFIGSSMKQSHIFSLNNKNSKWSCHFLFILHPISFHLP